MARKSKQPKPDNRCQHTTADGRRCRALRMNQDSSLCLQHWQRQQQLLCTEGLDASALAAELLGPFQEFNTATAINHFLGKLLSLAAKDRIPTRKAAVLGYIGQLLLNSLVVMREETLRGGRNAGLKLVFHHVPRPQRPDPGNTTRQATVTPDENEQKSPIGGSR